MFLNVSFLEKATWDTLFSNNEELIWDFHNSVHSWEAKWSSPAWNLFLALKDRTLLTFSEGFKADSWSDLLHSSDPYKKKQAYSQQTQTKHLRLITIDDNEEPNNKANQEKMKRG